MNALPLTRRPLDSRSGIGTIFTTALAIMGIGLFIAFIALPIGGSSHTAPKPATSGSQTLIHFYGTGAPPVVRHYSTSSHTNSQHFYGLQP
jgi:hypothetical protein